MCGIVGVLGKRDVIPLLVDGLRRLEYRGYDSSGVATLEEGAIRRRRAQGKIARLEARLAEDPLAGPIGIAHTRWATHGVPNEVNAHPHATAKVVLVHNGIIENYRELAQELAAHGHVFESQTDSEVAAHLVSYYLDQGLTPQMAVATALKRFHGAFSLAILFAGHDDLMIGARLGSPLAVGFGDGEMFLGSDALALAPMTQRIAYLDEGDWVELTRGGAIFHDKTDAVVTREIKQTALSGAMIGKGNYPHYMLKEIYEQPTVIGNTLNSLLEPMSRTLSLPPLPFSLADLPKITIVACGTSFYAALVAKYWFETLAAINVEVDIASEFRYREAPLPPGGLALFISQSGETADTLAALRYARAQQQHVVTVVNAAESSMAREADLVLRTLAGPEIGVASTKAFTCQLVTLAAFALAAAKARGRLTPERDAALAAALTEVPARVAEVLNHDDSLRSLAERLKDARDILYIGRGTAYPIAMEGALKLKELSYIHAEGYAAGELKHGPIALISDDVPVIVIAPSDPLFEKTVSNMQEVMARGGKVVLLSDAVGVVRIGEGPVASVALPPVDAFVAPILYAIPVQLLAYHIAVLKGTDVDQPRNLAKSVTVE